MELTQLIILKLVSFQLGPFFGKLGFMLAVSQTDGAYCAIFLAGTGKLEQWVLTQGDFFPPGETLDNLEDIFDCHHWGRGCC